MGAAGLLVLTGCSLTEPSAPASTSSSLSGEAGSAGPGVDGAERAGGPVFPCTGYGRLPNFNTVETNAEDVYAFNIFDPVRVGDGSGDIDWTVDPYEDLGWKLWLHSLRWIGPSVEAARAGDDAAFSRAETVIRDWIADAPEDWTGDSDRMEANTYRTNVQMCFREVVMDRHDGTVPTEYAWLEESLERHADHNMRRYSARHNHGSMENRSLMGVGCELGRMDWADHALSRVEQDVPHQISEEGLSSEAAAGYGAFNWELFDQIREIMDRCGLESEIFGDRHDRMGEGLAHMVDATGRYFQFGDAQFLRVNEVGTPEMMYAATDGEKGTPPEQRYRVFEYGHIFARSTWGTPDTGFSQAATWMLRGGEGTEVKGHQGDLMQFLYTTRSRQITVDGGHPGVVQDSWRPWGYSPVAHNVIHIPTLKEFPGAGPAEPDRVEFSGDGRADFVQMSQDLAAGGDRVRGVLVLTEPDLAVVYDRVEVQDGARHRVETLWNMPAGFRTRTTDERTALSESEHSGERTWLFHVPLRGDDPSLQIHRGVLDPTGGHQHRGFYYTREQERTETDQVAFRTAGQDTASISVLVPTGAGAEASVEAQPAPHGGHRLSIMVDGREVSVLVGEDGSMTRMN